MRTMFCIFACWLLLTGSLFSQSNPQLEVVAMFDAGVISLPNQMTEAALGNVRIANQGIATALTQCAVQTVAKAFPRFSAADTLATARTGEQVRLIDLSNIFVLKVQEQNAAQKLVAALQNLPGVVYAEPNANDYRAHVLPNDPHFSNGDQWGLYNYGQNGGTNRADIHAPEAWDITTGSNVLIGVIDDGVDAGHEDLTGKVGGDAGYYGGNQYWAYGHGTHVAGIAAAIGNNSHGVAGVNWAATINSQRVENGSDADFSNAITDACNAGSKILNNSWGGYTYSTTVRFAFANAYKRNVVSVASMGNDNISSPSYPAAYGQGIIAVGATTNLDALANYSNYGSWIDVVAPGGANDGNDAHNIWSTFPNNSYQSWAGTSMAAPFVSGIASLMLSVNSNLSNDDIEHVIQLSADKVTGMGGQNWTDHYGYGRVNAKKALDFVRSPYTITRSSTPAGGTDMGASDGYQMAIFGASGLVNGTYMVYRHEVRRNISFSSTNVPYAWGRGVGTTGWADNGNVNYTMGWCDVVPGTLTTSGATLRTYVYDVWTLLGQHIGYYPTSPSGVVYAYTVLSPSDVTITAPIVSSWNMAGIPNVVHDFTRTAVYPTSISTAQRWDPNTGTYIATDPLRNGEGYWIKFPNPPGTVTHTGAPIYSYAMNVIVGASSAWNLIGSISKNVSTSSVIQNPPNIVASEYYTYSHGYVTVTTLDPGHGFWVKVSASGTLTLQSTPPKELGTSESFAALDKFTVSDAAGGKQDMYVRNGSALTLAKGESGGIELPPPPPEDFFDVRFKTNNYVQAIHPDKGVTRLPISVRNVVFPITLSWDTHPKNGITYALSLDGRNTPKTLNGSGSMTIPSLSDGVIHLEAAAVMASMPRTFALGQNYPNPFNPTTTIGYQLPVAAFVSLKVYDVLGREVAKLVNETKDVGPYSVSFDASSLPTGIYYYRLSANPSSGRKAEMFTDVKKMVLTK